MLDYTYAKNEDVYVFLVAYEFKIRIDNGLIPKLQG